MNANYAIDWTGILFQAKTMAIHLLPWCAAIAGIIFAEYWFSGKKARR